MKIIFLDVDGVLNNAKYAMAQVDAAAWDPACVERVRRMVNDTGAKIVISSTWRWMHTLEWFVQQLQCDVIDATGSGCSSRGQEIQNWLDREHDDLIECFVILDDDPDMLESQRPYVVQTHFEIGLTDEHVRQAIVILNRKE